MFLAPYRTESLATKTIYTKVNLLTDIILNTSGYTEPTLHFTLKYPDNSLFLYTYKNSNPDIIKLPKLPTDLCPLKKQEYLSQLVKSNLNYIDDKESKENMGLFDIKHIGNVDDIDVGLRNVPLHSKEDTSGKVIKVYLNSEEYLTQIKNENIVEEIKSHTVAERQLTLEIIRSKLKRHIKNIERPIYESAIEIQYDLSSVVNKETSLEQTEKIEDVNRIIPKSRKRCYNTRSAQKENENETENIDKNAVNKETSMKRSKKTGIGDANNNIGTFTKRYNLRSAKQETGKWYMIIYCVTV